MAIGIIIGIILVVLAIAAGFGSYFAFDNDKRGLGGTCLALCIMFILTFIVIPFSFHLNIIDAIAACVYNSCSIQNTIRKGDLAEHISEQNFLFLNGRDHSAQQLGVGSLDPSFAVGGLQTMVIHLHHI